MSRRLFRPGTLAADTVVRSGAILRDKNKKRLVAVGGPIGMGILAGWRDNETAEEIQKRLKQTDTTIQLLKPMTQDLKWHCADRRDLILIAQDSQARVLEPL